MVKLKSQQRYSISKKRYERSKDFTFQLQVENSKSYINYEMRQLVAAYEKMIIDQDKIVNSSIDMQQIKLRERLAQKSTMQYVVALANYFFKPQRGPEFPVSND